MDDEVQAALSELRSRIQAERALIADLAASLTQQPMRDFLQQATNHIDDAEGILIGVEKSTTPWILIGGSRTFFGLATQHRQRVEQYRSTYGPDVTLVG
jgi:hypothetical protein